MGAASIPQSEPSGDSDDENLVVESDPTGRFQRLSESLGKGAYKHVFRALDQEEGVEVAWNQLRIDHLSRKEAQKILSEIEILESIRNDHIINFYASWSTKVANGGERIVFVTELMSSGTLKQYLKKTLKGPLKPKVLKSWCRQILQGLVYLHTHDPPIIHRDLKCDNIFINGNNGQLKIGDLGLAVVRHRTHVSSVLGTPEFMAPELYDERYDEKVDIYAFGMCVLEMVTKEYPYSECTNQAQIYRKVTKGIKPASLDLIQDPDTKEFINRCLDHDDRTRPSAQELLDSEFLKPCLIIPPVAGSSFHPGQASARAYDSPDIIDRPSSVNSSKRSSYAEQQQQQQPHLPHVVTQPLDSSSSSKPVTIPTTTTSTLTASRTSPIMSPANTHSPSHLKIPHPITSPGSPNVPFTTTTTVDADNKTYHIRSNLMQQSPLSPRRRESISTLTSNPQSQTQTDAPTLHSHAAAVNSCNIKVVQFDKPRDGQLNLKMICTCPYPGQRDSASTSDTHEIKFPFDLELDTVAEVVAEMVREQILSEEDRSEATARIQELLDSLPTTAVPAPQPVKAPTPATTPASIPVAASVYTPLPTSTVPAAPHVSIREAAEQVQMHQRQPSEDRRAHAPKNAAHRPPPGQLNIPPSDLIRDQYSTSPTDSIYDHHSSVSSNGSAHWSTMLSPVEGIAAPPAPPVITESTFPPLPAQPVQPTKTENSAAGLPNFPATTYSQMVQLPTQPQPPQQQPTPPATHPLSPKPLASERLAAIPRPRSILLPEHFNVDASQELTRLSRSNSTTSGASSVAGPSTTAGGEVEDVGYTSPYRHGVSNSSINYHRRSPSMDIHHLHASMAPTPNSLSSTSTAVTSPEIGAVVQSSHSEPGLSKLMKSAQAAGDQPSNKAASVTEILVPREAVAVVGGNAAVEGLASSAPVRPKLSHHLSFALHSSGSSYMTAADGTISVNPATFLNPQPAAHAALAATHMSKQIPRAPPSTPTAVKVKNDEGILGGGLDSGYGNGGSSSYSSCPELSDDEDLLDVDLKVLKEQQRRELELMRFQHEQQLEEMIKLRELRGKDRQRRKSDVTTGYPEHPTH